MLTKYIESVFHMTKIYIFPQITAQGEALRGNKMRHPVKSTSTVPPHTYRLV